MLRAAVLRLPRADTRRLERLDRAMRAGRSSGPNVQLKKNELRPQIGTIVTAEMLRCVKLVKAWAEMACAEHRFSELSVPIGSSNFQFLGAVSP